MKANAMQQDVSVKTEKDPALNVAVNVSSKQNIAGGKGGADAGAEDEEEGEATRKSRKSKKKKKKKSKREVESSTSSDDSDTDGDRAKSKKKATAGVSTRINIFTGAQGPQGVGMQSGMTGPNVLSNMTAPLPVIQQQLPMLPVVQQVSAPPKKDRSKRSTKSTKSKGSQGRQSAVGMPAVIPPAMAGLVSGPDGQDVLVIPMPPGMKLPAFDAGVDQLFGAGFPFTDAQQQQPKKKKKKSSDATDGVPPKSVSSTAVGQVRQPLATTGHPEPGALAGVGKILDDAAIQAALQQNQQAVPPVPQAKDAGHEGEWEPAPSEAMADGQEQQSSTAPSQMAVDASPSKKSLSSEDDTNTMALLIFAAVIGIIVIVIIVFIVATAGTPTGTSLAATTVHDSYGSQPNTHPSGFRGRRRAIRRHPTPQNNYIAQLHRFKRPVEAYWNIK